MASRKFLFFKEKTKEAPKIEKFGRKLRHALGRPFRSPPTRARRTGPYLSKQDLAASLFLAPQAVPVQARAHALRRRRPLAYANQVRPDIFRVR